MLDQLIRGCSPHKERIPQQKDPLEVEEAWLPITRSTNNIEHIGDGKVEDQTRPNAHVFFVVYKLEFIRNGSAALPHVLLLTILERVGFQDGFVGHSLAVT